MAVGVLITALTALLIWLWLICPGRSGSAQRAPFTGRTFAHRGLYASDQSVPENSLAAFRLAVEHGYGVELDVQLTKDERIVVFHDDTLNRACGVDARVDAYTFDALSQMPLFASDQHIPLLEDVLKLIGGCIPVIVELKAGGQWKTLCRLTERMLAAYDGAYCVESFHPLVVRWWKQHAPRVLRGQLSEAYRYSRRFLPWYESFMMSRLLSNFAVRPQFIAYRIGPKCLSARACGWLGCMQVAWTVRPADDFDRWQRQSDAVIFEHFRPAAHLGARADRP